MSEDDRNYFRMRAEQELQAMRAANGPAAANAHQALAARYSLLADDVVLSQVSETGALPTPE